VKARVCIAGAVTDRHGAARAQELLEENAALVEQAKKGWGDRLRAMLGLGALSETSPATLAAVAERARALGCGVYARVGATPSDADEARVHGSTPVGRLAHAGVLDARSVVGPGRHLPAPDWDLLRSTAAAWAATPREDADEHGVMLDFVDLAGRGLVPALGSGGLTPHLVGEAEMVYRGARLLGRPGAAGKRVAAQALLARGPELAQRHFVAGLGHLVPGSPADLVVLDAYPATPLGTETWADLLVQSLASARSHAVMVAGEILFADGRATVVEEREVQRQARAAVHRMWPRVAP
jgi:5-methylthioadenosine/S-adenosylhomocysteine deaminase